MYQTRQINGYVNGQMNGFVDDLITTAKKAYGAAEPIVDVQIEKLKQTIRDEAGAGAVQAVSPYIYGCFAVSGVSILLSIAALVSARRARRAV